MRALLIAPYGVDLSVLTPILEQEGLTTVLTQDLGAGVQLADADLKTFDAAIAILPDERNRAGVPAVFVEVGIAVARGLPLLVVLPKTQKLPAALATVQNVKTSLDNREALQLHVRLFVRSLRAQPASETPQSPEPSPLNADVAAEFRARLRRVRALPRRERELEQLVADLLRAGGAQVEERPRLPRTGHQVDAAAVVPGEEQSLGIVIVEIRSFSSRGQLQGAEHQLQSYVLETGGGLGLLVYDGDGGQEPRHTTPFILSLPVEQLIGALEDASLPRILLRARNEAAHRM